MLDEGETCCARSGGGAQGGGASTEAGRERWADGGAEGEEMTTPDFLDDVENSTILVVVRTGGRSRYSGANLSTQL